MTFIDASAEKLEQTKIVLITIYIGDSRCGSDCDKLGYFKIRIQHLKYLYYLTNFNHSMLQIRLTFACGLIKDMPKLRYIILNSKVLLSSLILSCSVEKDKSCLCAECERAFRGKPSAYRSGPSGAETQRASRMHYDVVV